jgi:hypothetical protein
LERSGQCVNEVLAWHLRGGTEDNHEKPLRIFDVPADIRSGYPSNTSWATFLVGELLKYLLTPSDDTRKITGTARVLFRGEMGRRQSEYLPANLRLHRFGLYNRSLRVN